MMPCRRHSILGEIEVSAVDPVASMWAIGNAAPLDIPLPYKASSRL